MVLVVNGEFGEVGQLELEDGTLGNNVTVGEARAACLKTVWILAEDDINWDKRQQTILHSTG